MKVYVSQMDSENFSWIAVGETPEKAERAILKLWNSAPERRERKTLKQLKEYYGMWTHEMTMNTAYYE